MNTAKFLSHSRGSFTALRFLAVAALAIMPFTFDDGFVPLKMFIGSIVCAGIWLGSLLMAWRSRNQVWFVVSFLVMMVVPRVFGVLSQDVTVSMSYQWLLYVLIFTGLPLLVSPTHMRGIARLNQTKEGTEQGGDGDAEEAV